MGEPIQTVQKEKQQNDKKTDQRHTKITTTTNKVYAQAVSLFFVLEKIRE